MTEFNYLNGQILPWEETKIHVSDLGLLRGYGILDFFRVINNKPIFMNDHLDRFERGAKLMELRFMDYDLRITNYELQITIYKLQFTNYELEFIFYFY